MPCALQADAASNTRALDHRVPLLERQRHNKVTDQIDVPRHLRRLAADAQPVGVFQHQRQQPGRGLAAQDGAAEASG
ncbi:hypothetical protein D3C76_722490 [compost metagenome]